MSEEGLTLRISKLDAAKRQLRTAITMWFTGGDPVSTHTLAFAAHEIIHAVSKARDPSRPDLLFDSAYVREDKRKEFNDIFRESGNFFKHGDRDPHAVVKFAPGMTEIFFYYSGYGLELCGESPLDEFTVFLLWMQIHNPKLMTETARVELAKRVDIEQLSHLRAMPKHEFFHACLHVVRLNQG
jgi:hypothetical protein